MRRIVEGVVGATGTMLRMRADIRTEILNTAARLVVEEGLEYGPAKRRALKLLGVQGRADMPDNDALENAVREYLALFCADTQPAELAALRALALVWMERLQVFQPHLSGAVWRGTATRLSDIHLQLFCEDSKAAEITLIDQRVAYEVRSAPGLHGRTVDILSLSCRCDALGEHVGVHLSMYDLDDLRGALRPDAQGRAERGGLSAVRQLLEGVDAG